MAFEDDIYQNSFLGFRPNRMREFRDYEDAGIDVFAPTSQDMNAANVANTANTTPAPNYDAAQGLFSTYATNFAPDQAALDFWSNKINTLGYDAALNEFLNPTQGKTAPRFSIMSQDPDYLAATGQVVKDTTGGLPGVDTTKAADTTKVADTLTVADTATTGALPGTDKVVDTVTAADTLTTGALPGADTVTAAAQDIITGATTGAETKADTAGALTAATTGADMSQQGVLPGGTQTTATTTAKTTDPKDLVYDYQGKSYDKNQLLNLAAQIGPNITSLAGGVFSTSGQSVGFDFDEATKILGEAPTVGQQVVLDMARNLLNMGVTDLSQLNIKEQKEDLEVFEILDEQGRPTGTYGTSVQDPNNPEGTMTRILTPEEAARIRTESSQGSEGENVRKIAEDILTGRTLYSGDQLINASNQVTEGLSFDIGVTYTGPDSTRYRLIMNPTTGKPEFAAYYSSTSDMDKVGAILTMASFVPQLAIFAKSLQAAISIRNGDVLGGLANLAGANGFNNVATALNVANAAKNGDAVQLVSALVSNADVAKAAGDIKIAGDISLKDVGNGIKLADAINNQNWSGALTIAGTMSNSPDLVTAGAATKVITAIQSGNPILIADAAMNLNKVTNAANNITDQNVATKIADSVKNTQVASLNTSVTGTATDAVGDMLDTTVGGGGNDLTVKADDVSAEDTFTGLDQLAVDTFVDAKNKGATDEEALNAANSVLTASKTTVDEFGGFGDATKATTERNVLNISNTEANTPEEAANLAASKGYSSFTFGGTTYALSASAQDVDRQVANQEIASQSSFNDAYKVARERLGPGQTFEWNGKSYSTDTREENPALAAASDAAIAAKTATKTYTNYDTKSMADAQSQIDLSGLDQAQTYGTFDPFLKSAGLGGEYIIVDDKISKQLIDPVVKTVGLATRGVGGIVDFTAGTLQAINVIDKNSPLIQIASDLKELGNQQVGEYLVNQEKEFVSRISQAEGVTGKLKALVDGIIENPSALLTLSASELVEEAPSVVGAVVSIIARAPKIIAYGINAVTNLVEAAGANYNDTKKQALDAGMSEADAHAAAQKSAGAAGALAFVLGPVAEMPLIKRAGDLVEGVAQTGVKQSAKEVGKTVGKEVVTESAEGGGAAAVGSYFATGQVDMNQVLTSAVLDPAVAGNVSGTVATVVEVAGNKPATGEMISASVSNPEQAQTLINTVNTAMQPGADLKQASLEIVSTMTASGMNTQQAESVANTAVAEQIITNINNYGDLNIPNVNVTVGADKFGNAVTLGDYLGSSVTGLGNIEYIAPDVSIGTNAQGQPITVGDLSSLGKFGTAADTTTAADTAQVADTTTDTKTGATTTTSTDATTGATTQTTTNPATNTTTETTINDNTGVNTQVVTDTKTDTKTTTTTDSNTNTTTQTTTNAETNVTTETTVNNNANTVTQTDTNPNTNTQTTTQINNDTNVVTETKTDNNSNTETKVVTDPNNNVQTTTVIDTSTGEVIDTKTTVVPPDWKEPVIDTPEPVTIPPTETKDTKTTSTPTSKTPSTPTRRQASPFLMPGLLAAPEIYPDDRAKFKDPFISSAAEQRKFVGSLDPFFQEVESGDMLHPEFMAETPSVPLQDQEETKEEKMPNYFTYGMQTDLDSLFGPFGATGTGLSEFEEEEPMAAKRGGLATPLMAGGGLTRYGRYAGGGVPLVAHSGKARVDFRQGDAVTGPGDGQSDDIPAMLADGEFVIPADVVAALGNGSTKAGSDKLYDMMHSIRAYHRSAKPKDLPPPAKANPLDYLKKTSRKARR